MNKHEDVKLFPGYDPVHDPCRYEFRNIRDNVVLLTPELLRKAHDLVVATGHKAALTGRCGPL